MITEEQYKNAVIQKKDAENTINAYLIQEQNNFDEIWARHEKGEYFFKENELLYAAGARCDQCRAGLAYPTGCGIRHHWSCSAELKGEHREKHEVFPFAFYEIKSEDQPSAQGHTTRPTKEKE